jgi:site-specific DNA recombinase
MINESLPFPPGSRLVAYLRDSGGREQELSIIQQEKSVGEWCKAHGYILTRIFKDEARSGLKASTRDAFLEMIGYLSGQTPEVGVLFWEMARFSRDFDDSMYYIADLRRQGYIVHSMTDNIPQGLDGRLLESIVAWKNAKFSEDLRKNIKRGQSYVIRSHHAAFGHVLKGYISVPVQIGKHRDGSPHIIHQLKPDPKTAPLIQRAFAMRAAGATFSEIHKKLHLFKDLTVYSRMLHNEKYIGNYRYKSGYIEGYCEPLIDQETWQAVQKVNKDHRGREDFNQPRALRSSFILTGMIYCRRCGQRMYAHITHNVNQSVYHYYYCRSWSSVEGSCGARELPQKEIEGLIVDTVIERILQKDVLNDLYDDLVDYSSRRREERATQLSQLKKEQSSLKKEISRIIGAIKEAGHSQALIHELSELEGRQAEQEGKIIELETGPMENLYLPDLSEHLETIKQTLEEANEQQKAVILRGFIKAIRVEKVAKHKYEGEVEFHLPIVGSEKTHVISL